jgi:hypothetical protein
MVISVRKRANEAVKGSPQVNLRFTGWISALTVVIAVALLAPVRVDAQNRSSPAEAKAPTKAWTQPRTPDGQPDLQGVWSNASLIPLERPAALAGKEFFTEKEMAEKEEELKPRTRASAGTEAHYDFLQYGLDPLQAKRAPSRRTSLIVDPPDGRIPPFTPEAKARAAARAEARKKVGPFDGPESLGLGGRCIVAGGEGPPMLPEAYDSNMQFQQGPGYVVILQEQIHDARIIPLDGRPHLGPNIRQFLGDSRGHWEGNTLVVDTTNFTDRTNFRGSSENLHVVERFTRVAEDTILYEFTIEDPTTWTRPWRGELSMVKIKGPIFEFACHEGNYGLANTLSGARAQEKAAAEAAKKSQK